MPIARFQHCSALVLSLLLPWLPALPLSPPESEPPSVTVKAGVPVEQEAAAPEEPLVLPGVVIEEIPKDSVLVKTGLQIGDVILNWERSPNLPANPEAAKGELLSYFDWLELEMEQVARGAVVLRGRRGGVPLEFRVEPGVWDAKVRPVLSQSLEEVYLTGEAQLASGDIEAAVKAWQSVAVGSEAEGASDLKAWVALRIGAAWEEKANWGKTVEAYREALGAARSSLVQSVAWWALGQAHEGRNDYAVAGEAYASALEVSQRVNPESLRVASVLDNLGSLARDQGNPKDAETYFLRALAIRERFAPQSLAVANSLTNLGAVAADSGNLDRAENLGLGALQIRERLAPQSLDMAKSLANLGAVAWSRGDLEKAHELSLRAMKIREQLAPASRALAISLNNLGAVARSQGDLEHSDSYHQRALEIYKDLASEGLAAAFSLTSLGTVAFARGDLKRAHNYYLQALQIREQLAPQSLRVATTLSNLGAVAFALGELDQAQVYHERALPILARLAPQSLELARTLNSLGCLARERKKLDLAHDYLLQALTIRERLAPHSLDVANSLTNLGILSQDRLELDRATSYHRLAFQIQERLAPKSLEVAYSLNNLGDVARDRNELNSAYAYYLRALEALEHQLSKLGGSYDVQADFRAQHGAYYHDMLDLLLAQGRFPEAFHVLESFRAQTFLTMLAERDTAFTADISEELDRGRRRLGVQYDRTLKKLASLSPQHHAEEIDAIRQELQKLDDEAGDIEARIRQTSPRLAALKYPLPLTAAEAQQALDPGTLLLAYSVGKEKTALFAISRSGDLEVKILPLGEEALRSQVKQLLDLIREAAQSSSLGALRQRRVQAASRELYAALLGTVAERIAASERLLILPDGPLHALPFAALVRDVTVDTEPEHGQYLAEWKPLHVSLSATVFAELKQRRPAVESNAPQTPIQFAAFGDPVYPQKLNKAKGGSTAVLPTAATGVIAQIDALRGDSIVRSAAERGVFDWPPLPYTRHEVEGSARLFPAGTARTFLGPEALEDRIKSLDPKTRILHLAAHGYTDEHLPSSSFVALTIPEDTSSDASGLERDNGLLQVWEIFERVRLDADLVVLSACDTGLGEEQGGEGLIGLTRAFQYAGARTVMASLWSVRDQATSELMIRFYKHLRAGLPKDESLRQAQIELIRGPIEVVNEKGEKILLDASAPYFWAGFQVYGDWQ